MKTTCMQNLLAAVLVGMLAFIATVAHAADPLPSWNDTAAKQAIVAFVEKVTKAGSPDFVPPSSACNGNSSALHRPLCERETNSPAPSVQTSRSQKLVTTMNPHRCCRYSTRS